MPRAKGEIPRTIRVAVAKNCRECNDVRGRWDQTNDCTSISCWLYPYRPGVGGADRVVRTKSEARSAIARARFHLGPHSH